MTLILRFVVVGLLAAGVTACSSAPKAEPYTGEFAILEERSEPEDIALNAAFAPEKPHQFLAEVKDSRAEVVDVKLRLNNIPMEIPMERVGDGTLWRGHLSADQMKTLAISGKEVEYRATVVARNDRGDVAVSEQPLTFSIRGPETTG